MCWMVLLSRNAAAQVLPTYSGSILAPLPHAFQLRSRNLKCLLVLRESAKELPPLAVILFHPNLSSLILVALMSKMSATAIAPLSDIKFYPRLRTRS